MFESPVVQVHRGQVPVLFIEPGCSAVLSSPGSGAPASISLSFLEAELALPCKSCSSIDICGLPFGSSIVAPPAKPKVRARPHNPISQPVKMNFRESGDARYRRLLWYAGRASVETL